MSAEHADPRDDEFRAAVQGAVQRTRQDALMVKVQGRRGMVVDPADLADLLLAAECWLGVSR